MKNLHKMSARITIFSLVWVLGLQNDTAYSFSLSPGTNEESEEQAGVVRRSRNTRSFSVFSLFSSKSRASSSTSYPGEIELTELMSLNKNGARSRAQSELVQPPGSRNRIDTVYFDVDYQHPEEVEAADRAAGRDLREQGNDESDQPNSSFGRTSIDITTTFNVLYDTQEVTYNMRVSLPTDAVVYIPQSNDRIWKKLVKKHMNKKTLSARAWDQYMRPAITQAKNVQDFYSQIATKQKEQDSMEDWAKKYNLPISPDGVDDDEQLEDATDDRIRLLEWQLDGVTPSQLSRQKRKEEDQNERVMLDYQCGHSASQMSMWAAYNANHDFIDRKNFTERKYFKDGRLLAQAVWLRHKGLKLGKQSLNVTKTLIYALTGANNSKSCNLLEKDMGKDGKNNDRYMKCCGMFSAGMTGKLTGKSDKHSTAAGYKCTGNKQLQSSEVRQCLQFLTDTFPMDKPHKVLYSVGAAARGALTAVAKTALFYYGAQYATEFAVKYFVPKFADWLFANKDILNAVSAVAMDVCHNLILLLQGKLDPNAMAEMGLTADQMQNMLEAQKQIKQAEEDGLEKIKDDAAKESGEKMDGEKPDPPPEDPHAGKSRPTSMGDDNFPLTRNDEVRPVCNAILGLQSMGAMTAALGSLGVGAEAIGVIRGMAMAAKAADGIAAGASAAAGIETLGMSLASFLATWAGLVVACNAMTVIPWIGTMMRHRVNNILNLLSASERQVEWDAEAKKYEEEINKWRQEMDKWNTMDAARKAALAQLVNTIMQKINDVQFADNMQAKMEQGMKDLVNQLEDPANKPKIEEEMKKAIEPHRKEAVDWATGKVKALNFLHETWKLRTKVKDIWAVKSAADMRCKLAMEDSIKRPFILGATLSQGPATCERNPMTMIAEKEIGAGWVPETDADYYKKDDKSGSFLNGLLKWRGKQTPKNKKLSDASSSSKSEQDNEDDNIGYHECCKFQGFFSAKGTKNRLTGHCGFRYTEGMTADYGSLNDRNFLLANQKENPLFKDMSLEETETSLRRSMRQLFSRKLACLKKLGIEFNEQAVIDQSDKESKQLGLSGLVTQSPEQTLVLYRFWKQFRNRKTGRFSLQRPKIFQDFSRRGPVVQKLRKQVKAFRKRKGKNPDVFVTKDGILTRENPKENENEFLLNNDQETFGEEIDIEAEVFLWDSNLQWLFDASMRKQDKDDKSKKPLTVYQFKFTMNIIQKLIASKNNTPIPEAHRGQKLLFHLRCKNPEHALAFVKMSRPVLEPLGIRCFIAELYDELNEKLSDSDLAEERKRMGRSAVQALPEWLQQEADPSVGELEEEDELEDQHLAFHHEDEDSDDESGHAEGHASEQAGAASSSTAPTTEQEPSSSTTTSSVHPSSIHRKFPRRGRSKTYPPDHATTSRKTKPSDKLKQQKKWRKAYMKARLKAKLKQKLAEHKEKALQQLEENRDELHEKATDSKQQLQKHVEEEIEKANLKPEIADNKAEIHDKLIQETLRMAAFEYAGRRDLSVAEIEKKITEMYEDLLKESRDSKVVFAGHKGEEEEGLEDATSSFSTYGGILPVDQKPLGPRNDALEQELAESYFKHLDMQCSARPMEMSCGVLGTVRKEENPFILKEKEQAVGEVKTTDERKIFRASEDGDEDGDHVVSTGEEDDDDHVAVPESTSIKIPTTKQRPLNPAMKYHIEHSNLPTLPFTGINALRKTDIRNRAIQLDFEMSRKLLAETLPHYDNELEKSGLVQNLGEDCYEPCRKDKPNGWQGGKCFKEQEVVAEKKEDHVDHAQEGEQGEKKESTASEEAAGVAQDGTTNGSTAGRAVPPAEEPEQPQSTSRLAGCFSFFWKKRKNSQQQAGTTSTSSSSSSSSEAVVATPTTPPPPPSSFCGTQGYCCRHRWGGCDDFEWPDTNRISSRKHTCIKPPNPRMEIDQFRLYKTTKNHKYDTQTKILHLSVEELEAAAVEYAKAVGKQLSDELEEHHGFSSLFHKDAPHVKGEVRALEDLLQVVDSSPPPKNKMIAHEDQHTSYGFLPMLDTLSKAEADVSELEEKALQKEIRQRYYTGFPENRIPKNDRLQFPTSPFPLDEANTPCCQRKIFGCGAAKAVNPNLAVVVKKFTMNGNSKEEITSVVKNPFALLHTRKQIIPQCIALLNDLRYSGVGMPKWRKLLRAIFPVLSVVLFSVAVATAFPAAFGALAISGTSTAGLVSGTMASMVGSAAYVGFQYLYDRSHVGDWIQRQILNLTLKAVNYASAILMRNTVIQNLIATIFGMSPQRTIVSDSITTGFISLFQQIARSPAFGAAVRMMVVAASSKVLHTMGVTVGDAFGKLWKSGLGQGIGLFTGITIAAYLMTNLLPGAVRQMSAIAQIQSPEDATCGNLARIGGQDDEDACNGIEVVVPKVWAERVKVPVFEENKAATSTSSMQDASDPNTNPFTIQAALGLSNQDWEDLRTDSGFFDPDSWQGKQLRALDRDMRSADEEMMVKHLGEQLKLKHPKWGEDKIQKEAEKIFQKQKAYADSTADEEDSDSDYEVEDADHSTGAGAAHSQKSNLFSAAKKFLRSRKKAISVIKTKVETFQVCKAEKIGINFTGKTKKMLGLTDKSNQITKCRFNWEGVKAKYGGFGPVMGLTWTKDQKAAYIAVLDSMRQRLGLPQTKMYNVNGGAGLEQDLGVASRRGSRARTASFRSRTATNASIFSSSQATSNSSTLVPEQELPEDGVDHVAEDEDFYPEEEEDENHINRYVSGDHEHDDSTSGDRRKVEYLEVKLDLSLKTSTPVKTTDEHQTGEVVAPKLLLTAVGAPAGSTPPGQLQGQHQETTPPRKLQKFISCSAAFTKLKLEKANAEDSSSTSYFSFFQHKHNPDDSVCLDMLVWEKGFSQAKDAPWKASHPGFRIETSTLEAKCAHELHAAETAIGPDATVPVNALGEECRRWLNFESGCCVRSKRVAFRNWFSGDKRWLNEVV
ncbi:unnamed protein product [Amoebophrya sp. A120]|nr:unnamed protein product [Amoebophrya sp. A120]|eukprot:GSA120T00014183001.1